MKNIALMIATFTTLAFATPSFAVIASSPFEVRPLLIGQKVPKLTLITVEGEDFDLNKAIEDQVTILIFYRGGW